MFDDSNRVVSTFQLLNPQSLLMAILWMSLLIVAFHFIRKRTKLIQNFGILTLVIMVLLMLVRIFVPCNFPFTQNISSTVYGDIEYFLGKLELFYIPALHLSVTPMMILLVILVAGAIFSFLLFVCRSCKILNCFRKTVRSPSSKDQEVLDAVQEDMGKPCCAQLYRATVATPLTYGYFHPKILIPAGGKYEEEELYCVLLHELTHFYHRDAWIKLLVQILCSLFWWNPLMYLFQRDVTQTLELHCDAAVCVQLTPVEQSDYLEAIVNAVSPSKKAKTLAVQGAGVSSGLASETGKERMAQRLQLLEKANETPKHARNYYILATLVMVAVLFLTYLFIFYPKYTQYGALESMTSGIPVTQENSYLVEYPEDCYFLIIREATDLEKINSIIPLDDPDMVRQALEERQLDLKILDKDGFTQLFVQAGSEDPQADYLFWAYMYFPDLLTQEERDSFSMNDYVG